MAKINNIAKYVEVTSLTGDEILLGSETSNTGKTVNIPILSILNYVSATVGGYNGTVGIADSPNGITTGYWIANEQGIYTNFGGVNNIWTTGIISFDENGDFIIREFIDSIDDSLEYNDDFDI